MTALKDSRPHVFRELPIDPGADTREDGPYAALVGRLVGELLDTWPDVDLPTVRLWQHEADGVPTIRVDARRGPLPGVECPQCHQPIGRPHTDYCTLGPDKVWAGVLPGACTSCRRDYDQAPGPECQTRDVHDDPGPKLVCRRCNGYGLTLVDGEQTHCPDCTRPTRPSCTCDGLLGRTIPGPQHTAGCPMRIVADQ